jgi:glycerol-3-phosphate acyltransferase PlsX
MIAIDAMGGDFAPHSVIQGALNAAAKGIPVQLYGDEQVIQDILYSLSSSWHLMPISIIHCTESISMDDEPTRGVLRKKDSSLNHAIKAVADGKAHAIVSAGNSGASLVAGMMIIGKLPGVLRPAIGGFLPTKVDSVFCIDLGANIDCKPEFLYQFAILGSAYVSLIKGIENPTIGLLSNGTESCKGTKVIQQAYALLKESSLNFVGNCEPGDIFEHKADVVVCEGFSGNIMLKSIEATVQVVKQWLKDEGNKSLFGKIVGLLGSPVFKRLKKNINKAQRGGALLLGLKKPLVIAHGSSGPDAIEDAIVFAHSISSKNVYASYNEKVSLLLHRDLMHEQKISMMHAEGY